LRRNDHVHPSQKFGQMAIQRAHRHPIDVEHYARLASCNSENNRGTIEMKASDWERS